MSTPRAVTEGISIVKRAIAAEKDKDYATAKELYVQAATKILQGSKEYPPGSSEESSARNKATQYANRADKLSQMLQRKQPAPAASASDIYRVPPSQMYQATHLSGSGSGSGSGSSSRNLNNFASVPENERQQSLSESLLDHTTILADEAPPAARKRCLLFSIGLLVVFASIAIICYFLFGSSSGGAPSPSGNSPAPGGASTPSSNPHPPAPPTPQPCGKGPDWQLWNGLVDSSAWYDYIDVNVPVTKHPVQGILSNGEHVELEIDIDMGGTSKRSSQLYANPEFQQHYDDLIREWNPSASTRTGTVDSCGFPDGEQADTTHPELEDFKQVDCVYEDFNDGLNLDKFRPLEQKACCENGPPQGNSACWKWSNGTSYPPGCSTESGYKFNGNIGVEEMDVEYPHNGQPVKKNVVRLTSRNEDAIICSDPFTSAAIKKLLCHKTVMSSGLLQTSNMYASAKFEVVAKVPADRGLVWAIWTFHQELHVPGKLGCDDYSCYADGFPGGELGNETVVAGDGGGGGGTSAESSSSSSAVADSDGTYVFTPETKWDDCCDTVDCCLDPTPPPMEEKNSFLRAVTGSTDKCPTKKSDRISNSTCACCAYNLDNNQYPNHKYNAPCCIASKQKIGPCTNPNLCDKDYYTDLRTPKCNYAKDPQWLRNASMVSWLNKINHEIDIEIPASCYDSEVCGVAAGQCGLHIEDGKWCNTTLRDTTGCVQDYSTMNANNYRLTTTGGTGHAYSNMCLRANKKPTKGAKEPEPFMLAGDGKFHKYTIDWHTGGPDCEARVDFYVDDILLSSNNVMVPTRGSRFVFGSWGPEKGAATSTAGKFNNEWTNFPDFWGNGRPGDQKSYLSHVYVSEVKITPHNEANDIMYPATLDRKDGCKKIWGQEKNSCHQHWETDEQLGWKDKKIPPKISNGAKGSMAGTC